MTSSTDICQDCRLEQVDVDNPIHRLCHTCLSEHSMTWAKLDRALLDQ